MSAQLENEMVLVVDDDDLILTTLDLLLSQYWTVLTALSVDEAIEILEREDIAVVLADQRMPGKTGVDLLSWMVQNDPDAIRILITGYTDINTVIDAINKGKVWYYIMKPWDNTAVVTIVKRAMEYRNKNLLARKRYNGAIRSLVTALEASHPYTSGHSSRVTRYTRLLCEALDIPGRERSQIVLAAQLHDIGKIGVNTDYLDKRSDLDSAEWENVVKHVIVGERILERTGFLDSIIPLVVSHHESVDGSGYPHHLEGDQIPLGARIIALADAFDAMTSDRAYRRAMSRETAMAELRACAGKQFDADLVDVFLKVIPPDLADISEDEASETCLDATDEHLVAEQIPFLLKRTAGKSRKTR